MHKRPQQMTISLEGRYENFAPLRRDFRLTIDKQVPDVLTGGVITALWADTNKSGEKCVPSEGLTNHAFSPSPCTLIIYIESEECYWSALLNVDGFNGATITLHGAQ